MNEGKSYPEPDEWIQYLIVSFHLIEFQIKKNKIQQMWATKPKIEKH
jgi:hypothetical protein